LQHLGTLISILTNKTIPQVFRIAIKTRQICRPEIKNKQGCVEGEWNEALDELEKYRAEAAWG
jgi:hypothetical protein